ncbi:MAG: bacteriohemerythrin, partial [candidate division Zixibacteria bacterium]|nr:hemerythrin family protein [candidate division Zixibacteria bacterium]NIR63614.1 hemerythrin family protein [candidate division Zixibacteria bacterium]NIS45585.1 hemerythrin family protein [candidate division Zixibacteria bacterium]NIU13702.1 hemerythrin family protein [candidate division Zixibacteria bacterium]NIV05751.1 bacteriohemerythrin [candidate division Zixibacteria bacterium]
EIYGSFITEIDNDHRNLIDLLNQLKIDIESGKQEESVKELIPKLMDYAVNHFNTEEKYMVQYDYPGTDVHKAEHEKFVKEVSDTITALEAGKTVLFYEVYEFLSYWVDRHITEIDREMLDYLREKITTDK